MNDTDCKFTKSKRKMRVTDAARSCNKVYKSQRRRRLEVTSLGKGPTPAMPKDRRFADLG